MFFFALCPFHKIEVLDVTFRSNRELYYTMKCVIPLELASLTVLQTVISSLRFWYLYIGPTYYHLLTQGSLLPRSQTDSSLAAEKMAYYVHIVVSNAIAVKRSKVKLLFSVSHNYCGFNRPLVVPRFKFMDARQHSNAISMGTRSCCDVDASNINTKAMT